MRERENVVVDVDVDVCNFIFIYYSKRFETSYKFLLDIINVNYKAGWLKKS